MIDKSLFTNSNFGLKTLGFSNKDIRAWNNIIKPLCDNGLKIEEFDSKSFVSNRWSLIIDPKSQVDNVQPVKDSSFYERLKRSIENGFVSSETALDYWTILFRDIDLMGFNIPIHDLRTVDVSILHANLEFYHLHLKYFPYQDLMTSFNAYRRENMRNEDVGALAVWLYIYIYSIFLNRLKREEEVLFEKYKSWYSDYFDREDFHLRFPSEQLTISLLTHCESLVAEPFRHNNRFFDLGKGVFASVQSFFDSRLFEVSELLSQSQKDLSINPRSSSFINVMDGMIKVFSEDRDLLFLQEVLDNRSKFFLHDVLPIMMQMKYGPNSLYNVTGIIKDRIFDSDVRGAGVFSEDIDSLPSLSPIKHQIYIQDVQFWYDLTMIERTKLLEFIHGNIRGEIAVKVQEAIQNRCDTHWINLLNKISSPILIWNIEDSILYPQWNLVSDPYVVTLTEEYQLNETEIIIEQKLLENYLQRLYAIHYQRDLDALLEINTPLLTYIPFQQYWEEELEKTKIRLAHKERLYTSRMKELGIFEYPLVEKEKFIYLNEMMQVEEEIRPYIQFVKKAFQSALPIRRSVKFSSNRHSSSGVEFDPDTLFDQEKWIRANVMKVMESSIQRGEAIQINTFCLDFSGSMRNNRMRNLFKIIYLLVLGLEDRKSFDAFHFFSNNFIEAINFSNEFTSRKVLFRLLRQISKLTTEGLKYGGFGATNMSEGIEKSLEKMNLFADEFKRVNPSTNVVISMFVISDGEPNLGVTNPKLLNKYVEDSRMKGDVEIKAIFIKSEDDVNSNFLQQIFGEEHCVESRDFKEGVDRFVSIMIETYKKQRKTYRWKQKRQKLGLSE